jgi:hypothetical protein
MRKNQYFIDYTSNLKEFLYLRGIPHIVSEADIICVSIDGWNDTEFSALMMEYCLWLIEHQNDMTINLLGDKSKYHSKNIKIKYQ